MNYSQRKHLERLMADAPGERFDPFRLGTPGRLMGLDIVTSPDVPRYTLPAELMPGVPWPPGFRDDLNRWSRSFLGTTNVLPRGMSYVLAGHTVVMHPKDLVHLSSIF